MPTPVLFKEFEEQRFFDFTSLISIDGETLGYFYTSGLMRHTALQQIVVLAVMPQCFQSDLSLLAELHLLKLFLNTEEKSFFLLFTSKRRCGMQGDSEPVSSAP